MKDNRDKQMAQLAGWTWDLSGYAQGGYAAEMEQAALMAEAKETMER